MQLLIEWLEDGAVRMGVHGTARLKQQLSFFHMHFHFSVMIAHTHPYPFICARLKMNNGSCSAPNR